MINREIKFRQATYLHGAFHSFHYWGFIDSGFHGPQVSMASLKEAHANSGQFTGLKDVNGVEIWEGDLLKEIVDADSPNYVLSEVFWHDNDSAANHIGFQMNRHHFHGNVGGISGLQTFLPKYTAKMIVVGNVYENPELLEQK